MKTYENYKPSGIEWVGDIPKHWTDFRIKTLFMSERNGIWGDEPKGDETDVLCIRVADFNKGFDKLSTDKNTHRNIGQKDFEQRKLEFGDLLIEKSGGGEFSPVGRVGIYDLEGENAVCSNFMAQLKVDSSKVTPKFLFYYFKKLYGIGVNSRSIKQTTGIQNLDTYSYFSEHIFIPPIPEQIVITTYLDDKTAQIDKLIIGKQELIKLLKEERLGVINQTVTRGINPHVKLRPSGIEWIGDIPEHWKLVPLTKYLESIIDYRGKTPTKSESGIFLVTARNIKNGEINYSLSQEYILEEEYKKTMSRGELQVGDVLFTTEAPLGEAANVDRTDVAVAQRVIKFRGKKGVLNNYFLKHWILSPMFQQDLYSYSTGSTAIGIKGSKLFHLRLLLPPIEEQEHILDYISEQSNQFDATVSKIEKEIDYLQEYCTALISEVVTGKIKVA